MKNYTEHLKGAAARIFEGVIVSYQITISPDHSWFRIAPPPIRCRFFPSCSEYARLAIRQYGLTRGGVLSLKRVLRCNPWNGGGYDPPEK